MFGVEYLARNRQFYVFKYLHYFQKLKLSSMFYSFNRTVKYIFEIYI